MKIANVLNALPVNKETPAPARLKTPWTDQVIPERVWQEYPRPQMVRNSYMNLNGLWDYAVTTPSGKTEPQSWEGKILVPFSPEAPLSGVNRQLLPGQVLHYRRRFTLDKRPESMRLLLHFGAVDERCRVCVNGREAGRHRGGYLPFTFDITELAHSGENTLTLSCRDDSDQSCHSRGKQALKRGGIFYTAQSGIWQTVWMEWVPDIYIESIRLTPDYDGGRLHVEIRTDGSLRSMPEFFFHVQAHTQGKNIAELSTELRDFYLDIPNFIPWTPENPYLYDLTVECCTAFRGKDEPQLPNGYLVTDRVRSYFAMRCFTVEQDEGGVARLCLNHIPYFQNGVLDQGYWPDGLYTAPCDEAMISDIRAMKAAGFNMLRKHCKLEPLRWYYHCDRLGMLVWQDLVNGGSSYDMTQVCYLPTLLPSYSICENRLKKASGRREADGREEWFDETRRTMRYLYNCPCLASWVIFNEGWGQFDTEAATGFVRGLDPTRTVDQASGWFDRQGGDMRSVHNYFRRLRVPKINTVCRNSVRKQPRDGSLPASEGTSPNLCGLRASVISEYGGMALALPGHTSTERIFGYRNLHSAAEFRKRFDRLQKQIRALAGQGLSAAVYTQVSDIEDEVNGVLSYDRKVNKLKTQVL